MRFNKKASMELGISTVVVLVIAMVIIAGGIAFIRGFFKLGTDKLGGAFNVGDFGIQPTSSDPLVLVDGSSIDIKTGERKEVKVGYYNTKGSDKFVSIGFGDCVSTVALTGECADPTFKAPLIDSLTSNVLNGESFGFRTFVTPSCRKGNVEKKLPAGDYICELIAYDCVDKACACLVAGTCQQLNSAQITIKVNS